MLRYPCLVLDHDDTVVQSETTVNYDFFLGFLGRVRPGATISVQDYVRICCSEGFNTLCRRCYGMTDEEMDRQYVQWKAYVMTHVPPPFPGMKALLHRFREAGGILCVASQSSRDNILRDYSQHFSLIPDAIYDCELPPKQQKPSPYALFDIMNTYGFSPDQLLMVDDALAARKMAAAAGVKFAFAGWSRLDFPDLAAQMKALCDLSFDSVAELEKYLFE